MPNKKIFKKDLQERISYVNLTLENMTVIVRGENMKIIGERLKQLREEAGFSQNKLAKLIGIQQSSLNRYESGFSNPTPETLLWFADYFDVSMDYNAQTSPRVRHTNINRALILRWRNLWRCALSRGRAPIRNCGPQF